MDYIVYVEARARELERIRDGDKSMLAVDLSKMKKLRNELRIGDMLYLIPDSHHGRVELAVSVESLTFSDDMSRSQRESWLHDHQDRMQLTERQWKKMKRMKPVVLVELGRPEPIEPFPFNRLLFGHGDDWVPIEDIEKAKKLHTRQ